jgi:hypothetical protein
VSDQQITALSVIDSIDTNIVARTMDKIHAFQQVIQQAVKPGHDIGIIPGTNKPTLLKPGAEKIVMMMGLSSRYEIMDKVEDYEKGFFSYNIRCTLSRNGFDICEGVGNCNSRESKYVKADPYSIANTILKMAKKRAYVDAALSVASLSDIFTQDLEDMEGMQIESSGPSHRDNQGVALLDQQITFGKHKGRTLGDLLENERGYLEWLAKSDNQKWSPIAQQVLEESSKAPADPETGEVIDTGDIPAAVLKMANKAGMTKEDLLSFIEAEYSKPWAELSGNEKSEVTKHLHELGQVGA